MWWLYGSFGDRLAGGFAFVIVVGFIFAAVLLYFEPKPVVPQSPKEKSVSKWDTISNNDSIIVLKIHRQ